MFTIVYHPYELYIAVPHAEPFEEFLKLDSNMPVIRNYKKINLVPNTYLFAGLYFNSEQWGKKIIDDFIAWYFNREISKIRLKIASISGPINFAKSSIKVPDFWGEYYKYWKSIDCDDTAAFCISRMLHDGIAN